MLSSEIFDEIRNNTSSDGYYDYEFEIDSTETSKEEYYLEEEQDSVNIDALIEDKSVEIEQEIN